jgi:hypothetical protein
VVDSGRPVTTRDLWDRAFASWAPTARDKALDAARNAFAAIAARQLLAHQEQIDTEQRDLAAWLNARAQTLCGQVVQVQTDLFGETPEVPSWQVLDEPVERLAAFASDGTNPPAARREADGVIRLYQSRVRDLKARREGRTLDPLPLGLLMLVPGAGNGQGGVR